MQYPLHLVIIMKKLLLCTMSRQNCQVLLIYKFPSMRCALIMDAIKVLLILNIVTFSL